MFRYGIVQVFIMLFPTYAYAEATLSLKAVAKNGNPITPTNSLMVARGDIITAEIYLFGWGNPPFDAPDNTGLVSSYQVTLAGKAGARSSGSCSGRCNSGYIVPLGWDAPIDKDPCPCDDACYPIWNTTYGCVGPAFDPSQMASISNVRPDYLFWGSWAFPGVLIDSPDIVWSGELDSNEGQTASRCQGGYLMGDSCMTNSDCPGGTCNANFQSYVGTLNLEVGSKACNSYKFTFSADPEKTFIVGPGPDSVHSVPLMQALTLYAERLPGNSRRSLLHGRHRVQGSLPRRMLRAQPAL